MHVRCFLIQENQDKVSTSCNLQYEQICAYQALRVCGDSTVECSTLDQVKNQLQSTGNWKRLRKKKLPSMEEEVARVKKQRREEYCSA